MNEVKIKVSEEVPTTTPTEPIVETPEEPAPTPPSEETPEEVEPEVEAQPEENIDYKNELENLEANKPEPKRSEKEKAKYTVEKIYERHPDLKEETEQHIDEGGLAKVEQNLLRQQVEGIIRADSKTEDEVKYKMFFYDNKIVRTGSIHEDADNALWLANKNRTRNAIEEMKRKPVAGQGGGSGQKTPISGIVPLSPQDQLKMKQLGLKQTAPDTWEGEKVKLVFDKKTKKWEQSRK